MRRRSDRPTCGFRCVCANRFGAEQIVAVTSPQRMVDFEKALQQLNHRRASGQVIKSLERYMPADARVGSVGFFTVP